MIIWTNDGNGWTQKVLNKFNDVIWHISWSITGNILATSGGDNKVTKSDRTRTITARIREREGDFIPYETD